MSGCDVEVGKIKWIEKKVLEGLMEDRKWDAMKEVGIDEILRGLHTSRDGINADNLENEERGELYGFNTFIQPQPKSFWLLWLESFKDLTLIILIVLAFVSLVLAFAVERGKNLSWLDGTAILLTVIAVTLISSFNTWSQEKQFEKLNERQKDRNVIVTRSGKPLEISIFSLMVGDIFTITTGEVLPADGLALESNNIHVDEASITGESKAVRISLNKNPFLLCNCRVQTGFGKMLVIAVGMNTQYGILKGATIAAAQEREQTPLQEKLEGLAKVIGYVGFAAAGCCLLLLLIFWIIPLAIRGKSVWDGGAYLLDLVDYVIIAVTIVVMAVPEGLPLAVTLSLAYSMRKMLADNNLVRRLHACETMGGATTICSDKTGTLTENKMKVVSGYFNGIYKSDIQAVSPSLSTFSSSSSSSSPPSIISKTTVPSSSSSKVRVTTATLPTPSDSSSSSSLRASFPAPYLKDLMLSVATNSSADIVENEKGGVDYLGNVTECALLLMAREQGFNYQEIRKEHPAVQTIPFSSDRKRMTVVLQSSSDSYTIITKGAPEIVTTLCTRISILNDAGGRSARSSTSSSVILLDDERRAEVEDVVHDMATQGLRTIGIAMRSMSVYEAAKRREKALAEIEIMEKAERIREEKRKEKKEKKERKKELQQQHEQQQKESPQQQHVVQVDMDSGMSSAARMVFSTNTNGRPSPHPSTLLGSPPGSPDLKSPLLKQASSSHLSVSIPFPEEEEGSGSGGSSNETDNNKGGKDKGKGGKDKEKKEGVVEGGGGGEEEEEEDAPLVDTSAEVPDPTAVFPLSAYAENDLTLLAIVGIKDPLRKEVCKAVEDCHTAKIVVRMVTGDNIDTAINIAKECGIYKPNLGIAMEGCVFRQLAEEDRQRVLPKLQVLARSSPLDKQLLVRGLKKLDHVVAVTGDGTNDAPALSVSDVGFAMGLTGTEVAKDAASIILTDDNFASIVKAVLWGRNIYDCIRKFLQFQLTVNFSAILVAVIGAIFAITPLKAVPMLWVNLIMDTLAALSLATDEPTADLLLRKPYGKCDSIICPSMWRNVIGGSIYESIILVILLFLWGPKIMDPETIIKCNTRSSELFVSCSELMYPHGLCRSYLLDRHVTTFTLQHFAFIFNVFIFLQLFNLLTARKCYNELNFFENILRNKLFIIIWFVSVAIQVVIMIVPGIRSVFSVIPIPPSLWGMTILFSIFIVPWKFLLHLLIKMPDPFSGDIVIENDPGVPAGVYRSNEPFPSGCEISTHMLPSPSFSTSPHLEPSSSSPSSSSPSSSSSSSSSPTLEDGVIYSALHRDSSSTRENIISGGSCGGASLSSCSKGRSGGGGGYTSPPLISLSANSSKRVVGDGSDNCDNSSSFMIRQGGGYGSGKGLLRVPQSAGSTYDSGSPPLPDDDVHKRPLSSFIPSSSSSSVYPNMDLSTTGSVVRSANTTTRNPMLNSSNSNISLLMMRPSPSPPYGSNNNSRTGQRDSRMDIRTPFVDADGEVSLNSTLMSSGGGQMRLGGGSGGSGGSVSSRSSYSRSDEDVAGLAFAFPGVSVDRERGGENNKNNSKTSFSSNNPYFIKQQSPAVPPSHGTNTGSRGSGGAASLTFTTFAAGSPSISSVYSQALRPVNQNTSKT